MNVHDATESAYRNGYADAIDEFANRLKKYYDSLKGQAPSTAIIVYHIDQIAKEMKEKNNGNEN
jgi:hypothetical protein